MNIVMDASQDQMDRVDRARLVESCGAREDSPSWNLGRAKQGDTIQVDGASPQGRGQKDAKESEQRERQDAKNGASMTRLRGNHESSKNNPISEEE